MKKHVDEKIDNKPGTYEEEEEVDEEEPIPLLFVDVNLGEGKMARIVLYDGDTPEDVANEFAKEHDLDSTMKRKLTDLLAH